MEGTVQNKGLAKPIDFDLDEDYRSICQYRMKKAATKTRTLIRHEPILNPNRPTARPIYATTSYWKPKSTSSIPPDRRERLQKDELIDLIFHAFEKQNFYNLKELTQFTNQPQGYLKETLIELCIYHKHGPNKTKYELKPEYKGQQK